MKSGTTLILVLILIPSIVGSETYTFPRTDGSHFVFETDWENEFHRTQLDNDIIYGQHSFTIHNLSLPVEIQFKRMALESNNCYNNQSWHISVLLSEGPQVIKQLDIRDFRSETIKVQPGITYNLTFIVQYDKETIQEGKHWAMVQMNVIAQDIDEPHYFFQVINYRRLKTQAQPFSPAIPILLAMMGIVAVIYFVRRQTLYTKEGENIESLPETKEKE